MRGNNGVIVFPGVQNSVVYVTRRTVARIAGVVIDVAVNRHTVVRVEGVIDARRLKGVGGRKGQGCRGEGGGI